MALKLVIGPANAEKAGFVLDGYRAALGDGEPLLVVPTVADVDHYRRELAGSGAVFGVEVMTFDWLMRTAAQRALVRGRPLGRLPRERVAAAAVSRLELGPLAASAATPGFAPALLRLVGELEEARATPARTTQALRAWVAEEPDRAAYAEDLAALVSAYHRELGRLDARDRRLHHAAALDGLRLDPAAWGGTPVFFYGFDDLTPLQRDAVETLACHVGADVTVSLTYELGRTAFAARARTFEDLRALPGAEVLQLEARADHYAPAARAALHHLERGLFEVDVTPADPGDALLLLEAGGERAEVELVGAHVVRLLRDEGYAPDEIAVVWRSLEGIAPLVEQVFDAYGIPHALDRRLPAGHTALGRGLLGLLRAALPDGRAEDLLAYLRAPGVLTNRDLADALEADCRRGGERGAAGARALWEERHFALDALTRVARAAAAGPAALCERLAHEAQLLLTRPHRGTAAILAPEEAVDARVAGELRRALRELGALAVRDPRLVPAPAELARVLGELEVRVGPPPGPGRVAVSDPLAVRARRVRALFACGLQEGVWPAPARPEPLLGDDERAALARASGLVLRHSEDVLAAERFVFYAAASRPTDLLVLSRRTADDDGRPAVPSFFLADVVDLFAPPPRVERRLLGQVAWPEGLAPTEREERRTAAALAPPRPPAPVGALAAAPVLAELAGRETFSASDLEAWAGCPVRWLVDRLLRPQPLEPDPEPLLRGVLAHDVLRDVFEALGEGPLAPGDLPAARAALEASFAERSPGVRISVNPERLRAELRRLEAQLVRYVDHAVTAGSAFGPAHLEHAFEADLGDGLRLKGRMDRVDRDAAGRLLIYDYKGKAAAPWARWETDRRLQMGLYLLAAREALGGEAVGGLYQPLGAEESQPRGLVLAGADPGRDDLVDRDVVDEEAFAAALEQVLRSAAVAAAELRGGRLEARPATCAYKGGCEYPSICRCEAA